MRQANMKSETTNELLDFDSFFSKHQPEPWPSQFSQPLVNNRRTPKQCSIVGYCDKTTAFVEYEGVIQIVGVERFSHSGVHLIPVEHTAAYKEHHSNRHHLNTPVRDFGLFPAQAYPYTSKDPANDAIMADTTAQTHKNKLMNVKLSPEEAYIDNDLFEQVKSIGNGDIEKGLKSLLASTKQH